MAALRRFGAAKLVGAVRSATNRVRTGSIFSARPECLRVFNKKGGRTDLITGELLQLIGGACDGEPGADVTFCPVCFHVGIII